MWRSPYLIKPHKEMRFENDQITFYKVPLNFHLQTKGLPKFLQLNPTSVSAYTTPLSKPSNSPNVLNQLKACRKKHQLNYWFEVWFPIMNYIGDFHGCSMWDTWRQIYYVNCCMSSVLYHIFYHFVIGRRVAYGLN